MYNLCLTIRYTADMMLVRTAQATICNRDINCQLEAHAPALATLGGVGDAALRGVSGKVPNGEGGKLWSSSQHFSSLNAELW
mmetsp:Transcript_28225/g.49323  ORF Transcript_28225/g.49323 Transcript_28225/m.49323 type:complete len:82 (-) Transcript_28225:3496-3741(-)